VYKFKFYPRKKRLADYFILYGISFLFFLLLFVAVMASFKNNNFNKKLIVDDKITATKTVLEKCNGFIDVNNFNFVHASPNMTDVLLFSGKIETNSRVYVDFLNFSIDDNVNSIRYLQLYVDDVFISEVPVFNGKAFFENLKISIDKNKPFLFVIKGKISKFAKTGSILKINFALNTDIGLIDDYSNPIFVCGDFPLYGNNVSIVKFYDG